MLVLTRKKHEIIVITTPSGDRIEVSVADIRGNQIKLGFVAEKSVKVFRAETLAKSGAK